MAATVGCQPRCSRLRRVHTQLATRRLSVGTSHRPIHFYFLPPFFFSCVRSPLAASILPFSRLRLGISCLSGPSPLARRVVVVATLKTELSTMPRGNGQLLLRLAPPRGFRNWTGQYAYTMVNVKYTCDRNGTMTVILPLFTSNAAVVKARASLIHATAEIDI